MPYPTDAEIDAAVPPTGTPNRANTNSVLKNMRPPAGTTTDASQVAVASLGGPANRLDLLVTRMPTIFNFGAVGVGKNVDTPLSSKYSTLAAAQAAFPTVPITSLSDQLDWAGSYAACVWMNANKRPISMAGGEVNINKWITMGAEFCDIYGYNAQIGGKFQAKGYINGTVAADLSYPTDTDPGPMQGCIFYFPKTIYYARLRNIKFYDVRFGIAFNKDPNSPTIDNCYFGFSNCGVITYQGSQTPALINCGGDRLGVLYVGSATCFPSGSPYAGIDNYYTDGLKVMNAVNGGFDSCGIDQQPFFDAWFIPSFLRPTTDSVTIVGTNKYTDRAGVVYTDVYTDPDGEVWPQGYFLNPTGRMVFVPYRTIRLCYTYTMIGADTRGTTFYGMGLVNTEINAGEFGDVNYEGMFNYDNIGGNRPVILTCGAFVTASVKRQSQISYIENDHGLFKFTGRGRSSGRTDGTTMPYLGANPIIKKNEKPVGFTRNVFRHVTSHVGIIENVQGRAQGYPSAGNPKDYQVPLFEEKVSFGNQETEWLRYTIPQIIQVPSADPAGVVHNDAIISYIENICGYMHVQVMNHTTGEKDYAIYEVDTYSAETLTLANAVNNGDTVVTFTSPPRLISGAATRFCTWRPGGTGNGFSTNRYLGNNQIEVVNRVAGLAAPLAANSTVQRSQKVQVAKAFAGTFAQVTSIGLGNALPGQESSQIGLKNVNGHSLTFVVWYSHFYSHD